MKASKVAVKQAKSLAALNTNVEIILEVLRIHFGEGTIDEAMANLDLFEAESEDMEEDEE